ncbi:hypothetical protein EV356DRAFT_513940 [Viridothelium virens]|uniref:Heterokaryon incompatibility domain-containing protein n=1 Tax=Viridothelium virens TaxID=1048519 RepID=A0A6A6HP83_VIRVR|nr:hypothetical protein EV356DRAFT_513940 [Viridothelium virens]
MDHSKPCRGFVPSSLRGNAPGLVDRSDQISINQSDIPEKNHQTPLMRQIYKLAQRAIVWLGPEGNDSQDAINTLHYLSAQFEIVQHDILRDSLSMVCFPTPNASEADWYQINTPLLHSDRTWRSVEGLLSQSWFSRLWVWQELQLSSRLALVQCGSDVMDWKSLIRAVRLLKYKLHVPNYIRDRCVELALTAQDSSLLTTDGVLYRSQQLFSSDPRDKVYGILGLTTPGFACRLRPQYSLSLKEVYRQAFQTCIDVEQRLDVLSMCELTTCVPDSPSWLPNLQVQRPSSYGWSWIQACTGLSCASHSFCEDATMLVEGIQFSAISAISPSLRGGEEQLFTLYRGFVPDDQFDDSYVTGGSLLDAFAATSRWGRLSERIWTSSKPNISSPSLEEWALVFKKALSLHESSPNIGIFENKTFHLCSKALWRRKLIRTKDRHIGIGPPDAKIGDIVCLILGCYTPMILRPTDAGGFRVVGDGYLHGLNDADGILGSLPKGWNSVLDTDETGVFRTIYVDQCGTITEDDPRLPLLPSEWERMEQTRTTEDPKFFTRYRNVATGKIINSDPRMFPHELRRRGVRLEKLRLV